MTFYSISQAAKYLGRSPNTLRNWDRKKKFVPARRYESGMRVYSEKQLQEKLKELEEKG